MMQNDLTRIQKLVVHSLALFTLTNTVSNLLCVSAMSLFSEVCIIIKFLDKYIVCALIQNFNTLDTPSHCLLVV